MPTSKFTNSFETRRTLVMFRGATAPVAGTFYMCLADTNTLTQDNVIEDFVAEELPVGNGYSRQLVTFSSDGSFDLTDNRHEIEPDLVTFTASGAALQYQTAFVLQDADPVANQNFAPGDVDAGTDTITITAHGLVAGEFITFTPDVASTLPAPLVSGTKYEVFNDTVNTFQVTTVGGVSAIDLTTVGSGTFKVRNAAGDIAWYILEDSQITINDGDSRSFQQPIIAANTGFVTGV